jgi:hypothetical protein
MQEVPNLPPGCKARDNKRETAAFKVNEFTQTQYP